MREFVGIILRSVAIAILFSSIGLSTNFISPKGIPLIYVPPKTIKISELEVPLLDENAAYRYYGMPNTIFVDTRHEDDYKEKHVKGALLLCADNVEESFPEVQPFLPEDGRLVLYCYGPECDMAERVAYFLSKLGYKNLSIMTAGFRAWESSGFPVESREKMHKSRVTKPENKKD